MMQTSFSRKPHHGFALIAALFLIVVLAGLAMFAVRLAGSQQQSMNLTVLSARAVAAANTGIEWGANRALLHGWCNGASATQSLNYPQLNGFTVQVQCNHSQHTVLPIAGPPPPPCPGNKCDVYELTATATYSAFGQPDFVSRSLWRTVSNVP
jgi:MSHA biogenesis protein MshP